MFRKIILGLLLILIATLALAQPATTTTPAEPAAPTAPAQATTQYEVIDAAQTRQQLRELLRLHPPEVAAVIELSPSLLTNEAYINSYPALKAFLSKNPEVIADPSFYFRGYARDPEAGSSTPTLRFWENFLEGLAGIVLFFVGTISIAWVIKTLIDQRRWTRQATLQADAHNKLLDRLASNEQLLTYIQTPAGRRFLETAPVPVEESRPVSAPVGRVLWSVQVGLVLIAAGIGFLTVSGQLPKGGDLPMYVIGVVVLSVGIGFVAAAAASFFLAKRLGIWQTPPPPPPPVIPVAE